MRTFLAALGLGLVLAAAAPAAPCGNDASGFSAWKTAFAREAAAVGIRQPGLTALANARYASETIWADRNQKSFSYSLDLTETKSDQDEEFEAHGVKMVCDSKSYLYLNGVTLDFKDEVMGRGFVFNNPNATHTCGCGSSFSA